MDKKQQTAVEWLVEQLEGDDSKIARVIGLKKYNSLIQQAKEIEKEQIIDAATWGALTETAEQYYTQTYERNRDNKTL